MPCSIECREYGRGSRSELGNQSQAERLLLLVVYHVSCFQMPEFDRCFSHAVLRSRDRLRGQLGIKTETALLTDENVVYPQFRHGDSRIPGVPKIRVPVYQLG
jgi:hypothetical protein